MLDIPPDCMRLEPREGPPNFMSPIIFFIMSSMPMSIPMAGMPPMPLPMSPIPRDIMGPAPPGPPELEVMVEDEEEEEENDIEDLVVPSGLCVEAAIICDDSAESCLTDVFPSSVVLLSFVLRLKSSGSKPGSSS